MINRLGSAIRPLLWVALALLYAIRPALALDKVTFGTNWIAQPEHGGYYQAVADGTYAKYGLDVTIVPGGPQINNRLLMTVGKIDFYMGGMLQALSAVEQNIPTVVIAAIFQKDPQALIAHPHQGVETFIDLKKLPTIFIAQAGLSSHYKWMKSQFGFTDEQVKPYTSNAQPFLLDKRSAMQGYVTSEPFAIGKLIGEKPVVFLLADEGYAPYSTTIETTQTMVRDRADLAQRFVDASIIGWANYLHGDSKAANALIKTGNPEMTDDKIAYSIAKMKEYGIVDSGDAITRGIGAISEARVGRFYEQMVKADVLKLGLDWRKAIDLRFVNKGVGVGIKPTR